MEIFRDLVLREIKEIAGIDAIQLFDMGLLTLDQARKWLVREKYFQMKRPGRTFTDIKYELSEEYGISVSAIEKLIYRKTG